MQIKFKLIDQQFLNNQILSILAFRFHLYKFKEW